jgi:hypothetical protein
MAVGGVAMLIGIWLALEPLIGLYQDTLADPLNQPEGTEKQTSGAMLRGVIVGGAGALPFLIGSALVKGAMVRKLRQASRASG